MTRKPAAKPPEPKGDEGLVVPISRSQTHLLIYPDLISATTAPNSGAVDLSLVSFERVPIRQHFDLVEANAVESVQRTTKLEHGLAMIELATVRMTADKLLDAVSVLIEQGIKSGVVSAGQVNERLRRESVVALLGGDDDAAV